LTLLLLRVKGHEEPEELLLCSAESRCCEGSVGTPLARRSPSALSSVLLRNIHFQKLLLRSSRLFGDVGGRGRAALLFLGSVGDSFTTVPLLTSFLGWSGDTCNLAPGIALECIGMALIGAAEAPPWVFGLCRCSRYCFTEEAS
ncbi:unnamed protein product, partial [Ectocarpus sp. 12 AP-2014]